MKELPADKQFTIWWINLDQHCFIYYSIVLYIIWSTWLLIDKKQKHKHWVLTEDKLDDIGARLEYAPRKSLKCLAQVTGVSKSSARRATQLLKLRQCKTTVIHALQPCDPGCRVHFCSWFLQSVVKGEIDLQLTLFSYKEWFHLQGCINAQNNCCTSNLQSTIPSSESWCLMCCKCK
jgi:hypothetical protein